MAIYYIACALSMGIAWFCTHTKNYHETGSIRFAVIFSAMPLFLLAALRYGIGTDYFNYVRIFRLAEVGTYYKSDYIFNIILTVIVRLGLDSQWLFVILSAVFCVITYIAIFKDSPYPALSIFLLVCMTHYFAFYNIMRQMVGGAILLFSIRYIKDRKLIPFLVCIAIAVGFHSSCILFLPFYWAYLLNPTPKKTIIVSVGVVVFGNVIERILENAIRHTGYSWYLDSIYSQAERGYIYILVQLAILALCIWKYKEDDKYKVYFMIQLVNVWLSLFSGSIALIERLRNMMGFPAIILIPMALENESNKIIRLVIYVSIIALFAIYSFLVINSGNHGVLPYKSIM